MHFHSLSDLLKEMLADEEDLRAKMKLNINEYEVELHQLLEDLGLPARTVRICILGLLLVDSAYSFL